MSTTHIHLLLNHFPILGTFIGCLFLAWGFFKKNNSLKTAAAVLLTVISLISVPVYLTGEPAEEAIEKLPGISETCHLVNGCNRGGFNCCSFTELV
jgi:uncharacterized membrane protein